MPSPTDDLPVPNPVPTFWTSTPHHLDHHRSTPSLPPHCDILIIGSGYAGVSTAYHIFNHPQYNPSANTTKSTKSNKPPHTLLLDARALCSGATARNGGHIKPDTYAGLHRYASLYGWEQAAALARFEAEQPYLVKELVEREGLKEECEFHLTRAVDAIMDAGLAEEKYGEYRRLVREGVVDVRDVEFTRGREAERVSGVKGVKGCVSFTAAHLWPRRLVLGLLEGLMRRGLECHADTAVVGVERDGEGFWRVKTERGTVRAKKVVVCTNAYTSSVLPQYKGKIVPVRGVACHIVSEEKRQKVPHLPCTYSLRFDATQYDYLIPRADGSIVVGGARAVFWHEKDKWWNNKNDGELVEGGEGYFDGYMQRYFHGWEDSGAKVDKIWTGIMGYSADLVPHIGEVPGAEGEYICAGFSGHGMPQIFSASRAIAKMVVEGVPYEQTGCPALYKTSQQRLDSKVNHMEEGLKVNWEKPRPRL